MLNVSEVTPRKNLLGLLRTWIRATTAADDAFRRLFARWYFDIDDLAAIAGMRDVGDELENVIRAFESVADAVLVAQPPNELSG